MLESVDMRGPMNFRKKGNRMEVPFYKSVIGNFMVYQSRST